MPTLGTVIVIILGVALLFGISILLRELFLWYWKINDIIKLLKSIDKKLDDLPKGPP